MINWHILIVFFPLGRNISSFFFLCMWIDVVRVIICQGRIHVLAYKLPRDNVVSTLTFDQCQITNWDGQHLFLKQLNGLYSLVLMQKILEKEERMVIPYTLLRIMINLFFFSPDLKNTPHFLYNNIFLFSQTKIANNTHLYIILSERERFF